MHEVAPILTALALVLTALPAVLAAILAYKTAKIVAVIPAKIEEVHEAVNSKMDKLLTVVKEASHAEGVLEGKATTKGDK